MNAIQIAAYGGPEQLLAVDLPLPTPGPGQVRVRVAAAGVNFIDTYQRTGHYPVTLPYVPGLEGAGTVTAEAGEAHRVLEGRGTTGKILLVGGA